MATYQHAEQRGLKRSGPVRLATPYVERNRTAGEGRGASSGQRIVERHSSRNGRCSKSAATLARTCAGS